jgi:hypothetical protein
MDPVLLIRALCRALVLPPGGLLLLALLGWMICARRPRLGRSLIGASLVLLLLLSTPVVSNVLGRLSDQYPPLDLNVPPHGEVIVVLAGGVRRNAPGNEGAVLSLDTLQRLAYGARLARLTGLPLLLSGGSVEPGEPESAVMERVLGADFGLHARWLEQLSRTTRENARETARVLNREHLSQVILVTSAAHMRRALAEFKAVGLDVVPAPVGGAGVDHGFLAWFPKMSALERSYEALYEFSGELVARLDRGR